jgi:hypothetical protein
MTAAAMMRKLDVARGYLKVVHACIHGAKEEWLYKYIFPKVVFNHCSSTELMALFQFFDTSCKIFRIPFKIIS